MNEENRNKLVFPLSPLLVKYIRHEHRDMADLLISTVEQATRNSKNQYHDAIRALEPLLKDKAKAFADKVFMFRKKLCREGLRCTSEYCLFAHDESELTTSKRSMGDYGLSKRPKGENYEVVLNRVDESKYNVEDLGDYASKFGVVANVRRLNRGKYLVIFNTAEAARALVDCPEYVFKDPEIKKFFNVQNMALDGNSPVDAPAARHAYRPREDKPDNSELIRLFQEQKVLLENLSVSFDNTTLISLKNITMKIRNAVLPSESTFEDANDKQGQVNVADAVETSLYYNMFAD